MHSPTLCGITENGSANVTEKVYAAARAHTHMQNPARTHTNIYAHMHAHAHRTNREFESSQKEEGAGARCSTSPREEGSKLSAGPNVRPFT